MLVFLMEVLRMSHQQPTTIGLLLSSHLLCLFRLSCSRSMYNFYSHSAGVEATVGASQLQANHPGQSQVFSRTQAGKGLWFCYNDQSHSHHLACNGLAINFSCWCRRNLKAKRDTNNRVIINVKSSSCITLLQAQRSFQANYYFTDRVCFL